MNVKLVAYTKPVEDGNPLDVAERAASICYDSKPTKNHRITRVCVSSGHESILEHVSFTFHISGVSRSLLAQITRHRLFSFSVRSQRYCDEENCEMVMPEALNNNEVGESVFKNATASAAGFYRQLLLAGVKKEDARAVLPNAAATEMIATCNLRELIHFCNLRLCTRAQTEIRNLAKAMRNEVVNVVPAAAEWLVPSCERNNPHYCPEGHGCGRYPTLKDLVNPKGGAE